MEDFDVSPPPTDEQRRLLCEMMHRAFLEIRMLGWSGAYEQAIDLAEAFADANAAVNDRYNLLRLIW